MITINATFDQAGQALGILGRRGESQTREIVFDCSNVLNEYPAAEIICAMQRANDRNAYLHDLTASGAKRVCILTDGDVAVPGKLSAIASVGSDIRDAVSKRAEWREKINRLEKEQEE